MERPPAPERRSPGPPPAAGVSVWIVPADPLRTRLRERIEAANEEAPFEPHVTLLGGLGPPVPVVEAAAARVAARTAPFAVALGKRGSDDAWFRSLYLQVQPSSHLLALRSDLAAELGVQDGAFLPHLSLHYGAPPRAVREAFLAEDDPESEASFPVQALHLWSTRGPVATWRPLGSLPLAGEP